MKITRWTIDHTELTCEQGLVAAKVPLAAQAGAEILARGGNAIDAAVATAFVAGVVEPQMSGLGGGGFMLIHLAKQRLNVFIDFGMVAPRTAHPEIYPLATGQATDMFTWRAVQGHQNIVGYRAAAVPGTVAGLTTALERYGTLSLAEVLQPAIRFAAEGYEITWFDTLSIALHQDLLRRFGTTSAIFLPRGRIPKPTLGGAADKIVQPGLAETLRRIADGGRTAFYAGEIARDLVADLRRNNGLITEDDLAAYQARVTEGVPAHPYRGHEIVAPPPACGASTILQTLNILAGFDLAALGHNTAAGIHHITEAARLAFADRYRWLGDVESMEVPLQGILSQQYAAERRRAIDPDRAAGSVAAGDPWAFDREPLGAGRRPAGAGPSGSTTHLSVVDADRNTVSLTQTLLGLFGCGVVAGNTGILLNNGMMWFNPEPGFANSVGPAKRPLTNMSPVIVLRDGRPFLAAGATGGRKVMPAVLNAILNTVDYGLGMQEAISTPRSDASGAELLVSSRLDPEVVHDLRARGHQVTVKEETLAARLFGSPACIRIDPVTGHLTSGLDQNYPAAAAGD